ncbi:hypothetical protein FOPE_10898 [Fonsecaea pedrosoi]|nr:hypothetical protein FOPE_10898 [Fonsecaea pedrosoi]
MASVHLSLSFCPYPVEVLGLAELILEMSKLHVEYMLKAGLRFNGRMRDPLAVEQLAEQSAEEQEAQPHHKQEQECTHIREGIHRLDHDPDDGRGDGTRASRAS